MDKNEDESRPAFPAQEMELCPGMSLRDYIAIKALNGELASMENHPVTAYHWETIGQPYEGNHADIGKGWGMPQWTKYCAIRAYAYADAMIKERKKK